MPYPNMVTEESLIKRDNFQRGAEYKETNLGCGHSKAMVNKWCLFLQSPMVFFFLFFFLNLFYLFIYFWLCWVFVAVHGLSLVVASGGYSSLHCAGFSLQWLLLLQSTGSSCMGFSSCGSWALECRLSSCGARAQLVCGMWDLPGPGLKPVYPALAGRFLTTAPPWKPPCFLKDT